MRMLMRRRTALLLLLGAQVGRPASGPPHRRPRQLIRPGVLRKIRMQDRLRRLLASASICACLLSVDSYAATMPKIDVKALGTPKTIVLMDIPKVRNLALIGVYVAWAPGPDQFHFSARADQFFEVGAQPPVPFADRRPSNYGIIGTLIEARRRTPAPRRQDSVARSSGGSRTTTCTPTS